MKAPAPVIAVVRHGWAIVILVLLVLVAARAPEPSPAQVDGAVGTEAENAAAMVKQQLKVERAEQLAGLSQ